MRAITASRALAAGVLGGERAQQRRPEIGPSDLAVGDEVEPGLRLGPTTSATSASIAFSSLDRIQDPAVIPASRYDIDAPVLRHPRPGPLSIENTAYAQTPAPSVHMTRNATPSAPARPPRIARSPAARRPARRSPASAPGAPRSSAASAPASARTGRPARGRSRGRRCGPCCRCPGRVKPKIRLMITRPASWPMNDAALAVEDRPVDALGGEQQPEQAEDRARRADGDGSGRRRTRTTPATPPAREQQVEREEPPAPVHPLDERAGEAQEVHVEQQVERHLLERRVDEGHRPQPPQLARGERDLVEREQVDRARSPGWPAEVCREQRDDRRSRR